MRNLTMSFVSSDEVARNPTTIPLCPCIHRTYFGERFFVTADDVIHAGMEALQDYEFRAAAYYGKEPRLFLPVCLWLGDVASKEIWFEVEEANETNETA